MWFAQCNALEQRTHSLWSKNSTTILNASLSKKMYAADKLSFTLVGDIMLGGKFSEYFDKYKNAFIPEQFLGLFNSDVNFANLECACSNAGKPMEGKILVYSKKEPLSILSKLKINIVNLANNHILDYGFEAAEETMANLDSMGISYFGVGKNIADASTPALIKIKDRTIAFLGFSWTDEWHQGVPAATKHQPGINPLEMPHVISSINKTQKKFSPDFTVVSIHWGEGKSHNVRPDSVVQARTIVDAGADMIVGHHTHCLQGYEIYAGKPIFYSLGNFLCSSYNKVPNQRLIYGEKGEERTRNLRERKTVVAKVAFDFGNVANIDFHPLVQQRNHPILEYPNDQGKQRIVNDIEKLSSMIKKNNYNKKYRLYRRLDEMRRILEDVSEEGLKDLTWKTPYLTFKKLITGKNMH